MAEQAKNPLCRMHPAHVPGFVPGFLVKNPIESTMCRMCRTFAPLPSCVCVRTRAPQAQIFRPPHGHTPRHIRHIRHIFDFIEKKEKKGGTVSGTNKTNPAQGQNSGFSAPQTTRAIVCTPENAREFQQVVKAWPELHDLVQSLQGQDLFPGLRGLRITLTGSAEHCAQGLSALLKENGPEASKTTTEDKP